MRTEVLNGAEVRSRAFLVRDVSSARDERIDNSGVSVLPSGTTTYKIADEKGEVLGGSFYKNELKKV